MSNWLTSANCIKLKNTAGGGWELRELLCIGMRCVIGCSHLPECMHQTLFRFGIAVKYWLPGHAGCTTFLCTGRMLLAQLHVVTEMDARFKSLTSLKAANVCVINEAI